MRSQVLLGLSGFLKKTQKTPPDEIVLAERRLRDWLDWADLCLSNSVVDILYMR